MVNNIYKKAYTEVLEILKYIPKDEYSKIPQSKIEFYKKNMDKEYEYKFDSSTSISEQNILIETNGILVSLFKDYLATEEEKQKIDNLLEKNQQLLEKEKRKTYNPNNVFNNAEKNVEIKKTDIINIEKGDSIIKRIYDFFRILFNKNK